MVHDAAIFLLFTSGRHFSYSAFIDDFLYKAVYKIRKSRPNVFEMNDLLWILGFCILEWQPILKHFISIVKCQNTAKNSSPLCIELFYSFGRRHLKTVYSTHNPIYKGLNVFVYFAVNVNDNSKILLNI